MIALQGHQAFSDNGQTEDYGVVTCPNKASAQQQKPTVVVTYEGDYICVYQRSPSGQLIYARRYSPYVHGWSFPDGLDVVLDATDCPASLVVVRSGVRHRARTIGDCISMPATVMAKKSEGNLEIFLGGTLNARRLWELRVDTRTFSQASRIINNVDDVNISDGESYLIDICGDDSPYRGNIVRFNCSYSTGLLPYLRVWSSKGGQTSNILYLYGGPSGQPYLTGRLELYNFLAAFGNVTVPIYEGSISTQGSVNRELMGRASDQIKNTAMELFRNDERNMIVAESFGATVLAGVLSLNKNVTIVLVSPVWSTEHWKEWLVSRYGLERSDVRVLIPMLHHSNVLEQICDREGDTKLVMIYSENDPRVGYESSMIQSLIQSDRCRGVEARIVVERGSEHATDRQYRVAVQAALSM